MTQLHRALAEIGERTPTYDVLDSAVAAAVRRKRRRRWTGSAAAFLAVATVATGMYALQDIGRPTPNPTTAAAPSGSPSPAVAKGPAGCTVSYLPVPPGYPKKSLVTGGDPTGRIQLGRVYPRGGARAVMWTDGVPAVIDLPGEDDSLYDVNSSGLAVGSSIEGGRLVAWAYQNGRITRLAGRDAAADAVNERGEIAGSVGEKPVVWRSMTGPPRPLSLPAGTEIGNARDIDDDGTVVGAAGPKYQPNGIDDGRAYAWGPDGVPQTLRLPETAPEGKPTGSAATAVRNGWVSGVVTVNLDGGFAIDSAVWNLGTGDAKLTPRLGSKNAVNARGWLAGRGIDGLMLVTGSREVQLPLPAGASYGRLEDVDTLSDDGATVAGEVNPLNDIIHIRALVWHCS